MVDFCTVSTVRAPLLSQYSPDPQQAQPRPGRDVSTACLLNRVKQDTICSLCKQASKQPGPWEPLEEDGRGDTMTSHTRGPDGITVASLSQFLTLTLMSLQDSPVHLSRAGAP